LPKSTNLPTELIDRVTTYTKKVAQLVYEEKVNHDGTHCGHFKVTPTEGTLPVSQGIYFLIDQENRIQKVGKTDNRGGLQQRMEGYEKWYRSDRDSADGTVKLWHREMTKEPLKGQTIRVFFWPCTHTAELEVLGERLEIIMSPSADLERQFTSKARDEKHPLLLSQKGRAREV
jgi:hypothetical protein